LGLHCWECNSAFDPRCGETHFDSATLDSVDCDQLDALKLNINNASAIYCRKIIQRIQEEVRTVRGCGWIKEVKADIGECYTRTGTKDIMVTYCHCDKDKCNGATTLFTSTTSVTLATATTTLALVLTRFMQ
ncbi:hypothetical protein Pcinc_037980, partial [Petrolisthes cinctipes]